MSGIRNYISKKFVIKILVQFIIIFAAAFIFSYYLHSVWIKYLSIYHTILETACIFIALSTFFSIWYTYQNATDVSIILGFGFLAVAIFDILHTINHLSLNLNPNSYFDLSTRYWILGRLSEAIMILLSTRPIRYGNNKWMMLFITLGFTGGLSCFISGYHDFLPVLLTEDGVTPIKIVLEYIVIALYLTSLYRLKDRVNDNGTITYKYIFLSLLTSSSAEFLFTLYTSVNSITWTIGHILKITSYYFIFRGIFISSITYPYKKLDMEHKELETTYDELNNVSQTLNDLLDTLPIGVQAYDMNGRLKYVNKKFEELFCCDRNSLYGLTDVELLKIFQIDSENKYEMKNRIDTYRNLRGEIIKLSFKYQKIRNGILVLVNDAREEQELENLHIQTETILNSVSNCVLITDKNKKVILCNRATEEILEIDRKDIIGMDLDEFHKIANFEEIELSDIFSRYEENSLYHEISINTRNGNKKDLLLYIAPIKNVDDEIIGNMGIGTDITELKKEQQRMVQQEKLALLGQMGAAIVHETRNYLTTIKGRSQLIEILAPNGSIKSHAQKIKSEVDNVNRIISEFLFLSKPRETEFEEVSMHDIVESVKSMIEANSLVKGVDVEIKLSKEERYIMCDEGQLKQVILNICKNAVDAMSDVPCGKLWIETGYNEASNEMFIKISDNGKGIPEEALKKIGTPFFTTKENGTGLGLSVCYNIIKQHHGRIEIDSKVGKGTTFTVILPCIDDSLLDEDESDEVALR